VRRSPGREVYVRPPLVAVEPRSDRAATWRFRAAFAVLLIAILVGVYFLYRALTGSTGEGSPGFEQGLPAAALIGSVAGR
jgi:hypothetical protein